MTANRLPGSGGYTCCGQLTRQITRRNHLTRRSGRERYILGEGERKWEGDNSEVRYEGVFCSGRTEAKYIRDKLVLRSIKKVDEEEWMKRKRYVLRKGERKYRKR